MRRLICMISLQLWLEDADLRGLDATLERNVGEAAVQIGRCACPHVRDAAYVWGENFFVLDRKHCHSHEGRAHPGPRLRGDEIVELLSQVVQINRKSKHDARSSSVIMLTEA
jgi:hypothetical protein